jgi:hypothetical protein
VIYGVELASAYKPFDVEGEDEKSGAAEEEEEDVIVGSV